MKRMGVNSAHFSDKCPLENYEKKKLPMEHICYKKQTEIVKFQGLENLTPIFNPEQEAAKRRELEQRLYDVFSRNASHRQT